MFSHCENETWMLMFFFKILCNVGGCIGVGG